ncbi:hypothetical protein H7100_01930 [Candidatus Saccharibacteria bacterium]|nr:hypothetical protein [Candidatus Saccharibacteria bacterium]
MKKNLKTAMPLLVATMLVLVVSVFISTDSFALTVFDGVNAARGNGQPTELFGAGGVISTITNVLLFIVGALSVIMLIIGGLRYVISAGNSTAVTAAKNTVLYAIVGLVISFLAFAVINYIISSLAPGSGAGYTNV